MLYGYPFLSDAVVQSDKSLSSYLRLLLIYCEMTVKFLNYITVYFSRLIWIFTILMLCVFVFKILVTTSENPTYFPIAIHMKC